MSIKQKILDSIDQLSEKEVEDQFGSGEGICVQLDRDNCIIMFEDRFIE